MEEFIPSIRDAVIMRLSMKSLADVNTVEGKLRLKAEIAEDVNKVLTADGKMKRPRAPDGTSAAHSDWDSQTGPVARILFSTFATQ
jgi:flagellar basal body-associated protein FliL